ncbi:MAG TPA: hypothetical protein VGD64_11325 [Acidisarcina sp.]
MNGNWRLAFTFDGADDLDYMNYHSETTMQMHNPAHPGRVLREYMGDAEVISFETRLGVNRTTMDRTDAR